MCRRKRENPSYPTFLAREVGGAKCPVEGRTQKKVTQSAVTKYDQPTYEDRPRLRAGGIGKMEKKITRKPYCPVPQMNGLTSQTSPGTERGGGKQGETGNNTKNLLPWATNE